MINDLFAVCSPGLESFTALELARLGLIPPFEPESLPGSATETKGGIPFTGDLAAIYQANLHLRTASRILLRLGEFRATAFAELRKKAGRLDWQRFLLPGQPVNLRVTCHKSRLYHSDAVAERVAGAIQDRLGLPSPLITASDDSVEETPAQLILVRLVHDLCAISIDSSGGLLHRRGYRLAVAKAPLRETLAAGVIIASGWDGNSPLMDPFCGSGTIPIEAALLARRIPPGIQRQFAFMSWPGYDPGLWHKLVTDSRRLIRPDTPAIIASDRDAGAIEMAKANAEHGGVSGSIDFSCQAVSAVEPVGTGWVVSNPPYGLRVRSNKDLRNLYAQFGNVLREKCAGWQVAILCSDMQLLRQTRLSLDSSMALVNGGVSVRLGRGKV